MVIGTGIDITLISRMEKTVKDDAFMKKVFTESERGYIAEKKNRAQTAAGIFSAKEACLKAYQKGLGQIAFHDMEVMHTEGGAPFLRCSQPGKLHLSISHTGDIAIAQVILESEED